MPREHVRVEDDGLSPSQDAQPLHGAPLHRSIDLHDGHWADCRSRAIIKKLSSTAESGSVSRAACRADSLQVAQAVSWPFCVH